MPESVEEELVTLIGCREFSAGYAYRYSEACGHSVEIVRVFAHYNNFRNNGVARPSNPKDFGQLLEVFGSCFAYRKDGVP